MGAQVVITGPSGPVQTGSPIVVDNPHGNRSQPTPPPGNYEVAWRVTSGNGHPITGTFRFTAEAADAGQVPPESSPPSATNQRGGAFARSGLVLVVALVLAVGVRALLWHRMRRQPGDSSP